MTLRAPIGESYLQHVCKHFKSWPACQPQPVPTGNVDVPGKSASVRPRVRARISRGSQMSAATIAWASIQALVVRLLCKMSRVQTSTHKIEIPMCHDLTGRGNPLIDVVPSSRGTQVSLPRDLRRPSGRQGLGRAGKPAHVAMPLSQATGIASR